MFTLLPGTIKFPALEIFGFCCCIPNSLILSIHSFSCVSDKMARKKLRKRRILHRKTCTLGCVWFPLDLRFLQDCTVGRDSVVDWKAALLLEVQIKKCFLFSVRFWRMNSRRQSCSTHFIVERNSLNPSAVEQIQFLIFSCASSLNRPKLQSLQTWLVLSVTGSVSRGKYCPGLVNYH